MSDIYLTHGSLHIGFHGCEKSVGEDILSGKTSIRPSCNDYDWLGKGFYVWDENFERAMEWSKQNKKSSPFVIGVIYELGYSLDLMNSAIISLLKDYRRKFVDDAVAQGRKLPCNTDLKSDKNKDKILRRMDCALINYVNEITDDAYLQAIRQQEYNTVKPFDTVRGCFTEGEKIPGTEIYERTHIQVCIRNLNCVKGFFRPRDFVKFPS